MSQNNLNKTPLLYIDRLSKNLGVKVCIKREDLSYVGSHKFRPLSYQLKQAQEDKVKGVVISTSGNAGIALSYLNVDYKLPTVVFVDKRISSEKFSNIQTDNILLIKSKNPLRLCNYVAKRYNFKNLRPSIDDDAINGYFSLGEEMYQQAHKYGNLKGVFMYITSGASLLGVYKALKKMSKNISMYPVQSGNIFSLFEKIPFKENSDYYNLGIKHTRRKKEILEVVKMSKGKALYVTREQIKEARNILDNYGVQTSEEGVASFAGFLNQCKKGNLSVNFNHVFVVVFSGKIWEDNDINQVYYEANNFAEVDNIMKKYLQNNF